MSKLKVFFKPEYYRETTGEHWRMGLFAPIIRSTFEIVNENKADLIVMGEPRGYELEDKSKPVIMLHAYENSTLKSFAPFLNNHNVKAILMAHKYYDFYENSEDEIYYKKWFDKILVIPTFCCWPKFQLPKQPKTKKQYDVSFNGTTFYGEENGLAITQHRQSLIDKLNSLKIKYKIYSRSKRDVPRDNYLDILNRSKVGISPFGWGETCIRDTELMQCHCIPIKPYCGYIETYPNIYQEDYFIWCEGDWSDLEEKIEIALNTPLPDLTKFYEQVNNAKQYFSQQLAKAVSLCFE